MATKIAKGEAALYTVNGMQDLRFLLPIMTAESELPTAAVFLAACLARAGADPEFMSEMVEWFNKQSAETIQ